MDPPGPQTIESVEKRAKRKQARQDFSRFVQDSFLRRLQLQTPFLASLKRQKAPAIAFEPGDAPASLDFEPLPRGGTAQQRSTAVVGALGAA